MYSLLVLTALTHAAPEPPSPGGSPPEQVLAVINAKGKLTLVHVSCACYGPGGQENTVTVQAMKGREKVPVKVKVNSVMVLTAELPAEAVEAYTTDGKTISLEKLATLLEKEKTVLVAMDGKKVDPFYLQLYKEGTIVLVPPANTLNPGYGGYGVVPVGGATLPPMEDVPVRPLPPEKLPPAEKKP
jgi:hypothetical protein